MIPDPGARTRSPTKGGGRIRILEPSVADRIAAGEVVERPASVVKELVENSLDASATQIVIEVDGAGVDLIRISDDGMGIHPEDLPLALQRFATSKVTTADDLEAIRSFGFRGEALPSIAAVSLMEIASAVAGEAVGRRVRLEGGAVAADEPAGVAVGTLVAVRQLFFNTPARRKFLKSASREFALIVETVNRLAIAHPSVAFRLIHEGAEVARYPAGTGDDRVASVWGETAFGRVLPFSVDTGEIQLRGWLGRPEAVRANRRQQYLYVNHRPISSRVLTGAVEQAYHQLVPVGKFPSFIVFLDVSPHRVDVNVHPRKLDVRLDDEHQVFALVERTIRSVLRGAQLVRPVEAALPTAVAAAAAAGTLAIEGIAGSLDTVFPVALPAAGRLPAMRLLGQFHGSYLLAEGADGLIVIDQHAAHERILYERLLRSRNRGAPSTQLQVTPMPVSLPADGFAVLTAYQDVLAQLGFDLEPFGDRSVLVRAVPHVVSQGAPQQLLTDLLAELAEGERVSAPQAVLERLTITTACHSAIKAGDPLTREEMAVLVHDLAQTEDPFTCFHGRPTLVTVPVAQVERWFLRR
ncbi:MAG TPA: DNA mismatch repair endonuclease MutL [bacterium]|nr:DNA mismatch repair endonuclease MutL [bacterium]